MLIPKVPGISIYPNGFPLNTKFVYIKGESIESIFLRRCVIKISEEEEQWLKDYVIYYINSPCFGLEQLRNKDLKGMTLDELIAECLNNFVDPF